MDPSLSTAFFRRLDPGCSLVKRMYSSERQRYRFAPPPRLRLSEVLAHQFEQHWRHCRSGGFPAFVVEAESHLKLVEVHLAGRVPCFRCSGRKVDETAAGGGYVCEKSTCPLWRKTSLRLPGMVEEEAAAWHHICWYRYEIKGAQGLVPSHVPANTVYLCVLPFFLAQRSRLYQLKQ